MDTIYALATARGRAGVSVIRLSGPRAHAVVSDLTGQPLPALRTASLRKIVWRGEVLDEVIVLLFGAGASFTGEDVAELQAHGSIAVVSALLRVLSQQPGLRLAEPGEFTRRALENGCLDLAQVEGLADLIDAETEAQRRQAVRAMSGELRKRISGWRPQLLRAAALLEATIDFVDEDVPVDVTPDVIGLLNALLVEFRRELTGVGAAERIRDGFEVAIIGAPNVGKSSLLNALSGREAAITSEFAGTTRDVIEVRMEIAGLPVTLLDTAGLRETHDQIEAIGIERAVRRGREADLRVVILESPDDTMPVGLDADDLVVVGKADLGRYDDCRQISTVTGEGLEVLVSDIGTRLARRTAGSGLLIRERHRSVVQSATESLELALEVIRSSDGQVELAADEVHRAIRALDILIGRVGVEDVLGEVFSSFCIGK